MGDRIRIPLHKPLTINVNTHHKSEQRLTGVARVKNQYGLCTDYVVGHKKRVLRRQHTCICGRAILVAAVPFGAVTIGNLNYVLIIELNAVKSHHPR